MENSKQHIVIVRTSGSYLDYKTYNCQELGLAKALSNRGWKVSLVMAGYKECHETIETTTNHIDIYYVRYYGINQSLSVFVGWKDLMDGLSPNIVQVHDMGIFMTYRIAKWAKQKGIPCVQIQGNYQTTQKPLFKQLELIYNRTLGRKTLSMVSCAGYKTLRAKKYIENYSKVKTFPTPIGLDVSRFDSEKTNKEDRKANLSLDGKRILLYVGSLEKRRNPDFLMKVLKFLPPDYVLLMVGNGPMQEQLKIQCHDMELDERCFFLGKLGQEKLVSLYTMASLFLLASNYEIYGMVIMEAMYFGLPVISSLTAGSETLIETGKDGCIISDFDENKWANVIKDITTKGALEIMSENARIKVLNELLWDKAVEKFENLYKYALQQAEIQ